MTLSTMDPITALGLNPTCANCKGAKLDLTGANRYTCAGCGRQYRVRFSIHDNSPARLQVVPAVGMGATILYHSDRSAATIIWVNAKATRVRVQEDIATRTDKNGMSEDQHYTYAPNPNGAVHTFSLRDNGRWVRNGEPQRRGTGLVVGERREFYDFSF